MDRYKFHALLPDTLLSLAAFSSASHDSHTYNQAIKGERHESVFKASALAAILAGVGIGGLRRSSSQRDITHHPHDE